MERKTEKSQDRITIGYDFPYPHRLAGAQKELDEVMAMLKEKQDRLAEVEGHIAKLLASYNTSVAEKQLLEDNIAQVGRP